MAQLNLNLSSYDVFWTNALRGFGFGLAFTPMTVLAFPTLPASRLTEASGSSRCTEFRLEPLYLSLRRAAGPLQLDQVLTGSFKNPPADRAVVGGDRFWRGPVAVNRYPLHSGSMHSRRAQARRITNRFVL